MMKKFTYKMLFEYPFTRLESIILILGFILLDYTGSLIVNLVFIVWLFTSSYTTTLLQELWKDVFKGKIDE